MFRNGRMVKGRWVRNSLGDVTKFEDAQGNMIPLAPGNTWVELVPSTISVSCGSMQKTTNSPRVNPWAKHW